MRPLQTLIALDQVLNTLVSGWADETLSARAWRCREQRRRWRVAHRLIDALFFWQAGHCERSYLAESMRRQLPAEYRDNQTH